MSNNPFLPIIFPTTVPASPPTGGLNPYAGPWEDGASLYANSGPVVYNGQNQTSQINTATPRPPTQTAPDYGDGQGVGIGPPIGSGMAPLQADKTVYAGNAQLGGPAQVVWYTDATGAVHGRDNITGRIL